MDDLDELAQQLQLQWNALPNRPGNQEQQILAQQWSAALLGSSLIPTRKLRTAISFSWKPGDFAGSLKRFRELTSNIKE